MYHLPNAGEPLIFAELIFFKLESVTLGSSVAVERIFSSGRDTISLRPASLKPETIRRLMLLKHRLSYNIDLAVLDRLSRSHRHYPYTYKIRNAAIYVP